MGKYWMQKALLGSCLILQGMQLAYAEPLQVNTSTPVLAQNNPVPQDKNAPVPVETFAIPEAGEAPLDPASPEATRNSAYADETPPKRLALLLPLRSESLGAVSEVIRSGFMAAWESESDGISVDVIESGDSSMDVLDNYQLALAQHDVMVGPLSRAAVSTLTESGIVTKPTVALNHPEARNPNEPAMQRPAQLLVMGLSIEEEARQAAVWASNSIVLGKSSRALVVSSNIDWQRRAAKAFAQQWQKLGMEVQMQEIPSSAGFLSAAGLAQIKARMQVPISDPSAEKSSNEKALPDNRPSLAFIALDAEQARQFRHAVGTDLPLFGTSQLNRQTLQLATDEVEPVAYLDGVRLLDLPWQLQRDHPAVMIYPRLIQTGEQKRSADLERLYALGIDAYRVARALALKPGVGFELDGVTGKLSVSFKNGVVKFERLSQAAMYRQGQLQAVPFGLFSQ